MKRPPFALLLLPLLTGIACAQYDSAAAEKFTANVELCRPASFSHPNPLAPDFTSTHVVQGLNAEGACGYAQTMPGGMHMACAFTDSGRAAFAHEFAEMVAGHLQGGTQDSSAWQRECEVVEPDGSRTKFSEDGKKAARR